MESVDGRNHPKPVAGAGFFRECLAKDRGESAEEEREWRESIYAEIRSRMADMTYVRLQEEFVCLAVVLDAHSRRVIGWALSRAMNSALVVEALEKAIVNRQPQPGLVHHSDQGSPLPRGRLSALHLPRQRDNGT
jgi:transposase InsO family protein